MSGKDVLTILFDNGWKKKKQKGSHVQLDHPNRIGKVTVPIHSNVDLTENELSSIEKQSGLKFKCRPAKKKK